jgi:flagellin
MRINHNIAALNTYNKLATNNQATSKSLEKLSSGLSINRAGDNAAGLAISEKMRGQIRGLDQASANANDAISLIQTAEGGLNETHSILQRMRELSVQAASDTNESTDRTAIKTELDQLTAEITRIGETTEFNNKKLLNGDLDSSIANVGTGIGAGAGISEIKSNGANAANDYTLAFDSGTGDLTLSSVALGKSSTINVTAPAAGSMQTSDVSFAELGITVTVNEALTGDIAANNTFEVAAGGSVQVMIGANEGQNLTIDISDMRSSAFTGLTTIDVSDATNAEAAVTTINNAINTVSSERSKLGAFQNRLEHTINNLGTSSENLTAAESRIRDVDMAKEMMAFTKNNILSQAAQSMLAQANQQPQGVLQLLQ